MGHYAQGVIPEPPPTPEPARGSQRSRRLRRTIIAIVIIVIVLVGIIGYAVTSLAYAQMRIGDANKALDTVISHQNNLNNTFADLNTKFNSLSSSTPVDPTQARTLFDQFVASEKAAGVTDGQDATSMATTETRLRERSWLTLVTATSLDNGAAKIDHAQKALAIGKTTAAGYVQAGQFFQTYFDVQIDGQMFNAQVATADLTAAATTLTTMKGHVDTGLTESSAPGLPAELHALMADLGTLVTDLGKLLNGVATNDLGAIVSANTSVQADAGKLATYHLDTIMSEIAAYYKPMFDAINSEMAKATA
jgi:hypothetical protein